MKRKTPQVIGLTLVGVPGFEPDSEGTVDSDTSPTEAGQNSAKPLQKKEIENPAQGPKKQIPADPEHKPDTTMQQKYVPCIYENPPEDLAEVVEAWARLSAQEKARVLGCSPT